MATPYGHIAVFHPESDSIKAYFELVQLYFAANKVPENLQVPVLLSSIGAPTYSLLSDLFAPAAPGSKSLQDISAALPRHFEPERVVIAQRFHFHKCDQAAGESTADYDVNLRKLTSQCNLGITWRRHSVMVSCVAFDTRPFSAICCQRWTLPMQRSWK